MMFLRVNPPFNLTYQFLRKFGLYPTGAVDSAFPQRFAADAPFQFRFRVCGDLHADDARTSDFVAEFIDGIPQR